MNNSFLDTSLRFIRFVTGYTSLFVVLDVLFSLLEGHSISTLNHVITFVISFTLYVLVDYKLSTFYLKMFENRFDEVMNENLQPEELSKHLRNLHFLLLSESSLWYTNVTKFRLRLLQTIEDTEECLPAEA